MEYIPYGKQWISKDDIESVAKILEADLLTQGPACEQFEKELCKLTGAKYCVAVSNATAGLHLAVAALEIKSGAQGITSPNTFLATPNALVYNNITPVFADIDERTFNITQKTVAEKITEKTKVVLPVHFAGQSADVKGIRQACGSDVFIVEDAAHAIGSFDADGNPVGACKYSDMTVFSFHPVKTITCGEGGAVMTNSEEFYVRLKELRISGVTKDAAVMTKNPGPWYYEMRRLGFNYRLTELQAALGLSQLKKLNAFVARRAEIIQAYNAAFSGLENLITPYTPDGLESVFHLYTVLINFKALKMPRAEFMNKLAADGIGTQVHYIPVYSQPYYKEHYCYKPLPQTEKYYERALTLPLYPKMTDGQIDYVINTIKRMVK